MLDRVVDASDPSVPLYPIRSLLLTGLGNLRPTPPGVYQVLRRMVGTIGHPDIVVGGLMGFSSILSFSSFSQFPSRPPPLLPSNLSLVSLLSRLENGIPRPTPPEHQDTVCELVRLATRLHGVLVRVDAGAGVCVGAGANADADSSDLRLVIKCLWERVGEDFVDAESVGSTIPR